ncbi:MAG: hypothetical protein AABW85_05745 [archaeon]|mgnify:CR=1 FL=1
MIEFEVELKKWGNSMGILVPKDKLKKEPLKVKQKVRAIIIPVKTLKVKDIFGKLDLKIPTGKLLKQVDKELDSKFSK